MSPQSEPRQAPPEASFAELGFDRHLQAANTEDAAVGPGSIPRDDGLSRSLTFLPESFFPELRKDLAPGLSNWRLCVPLGTTELRRRYSRSRLGQTWITVTTGLSSALLAGSGRRFGTSPSPRSSCMCWSARSCGSSSPAS